MEGPKSERGGGGKKIKGRARLGIGRDRREVQRFRKLNRSI